MEEVLRRLEREDARLRAEGPSEEEKKAWGVKTKIGFWITGRETGRFLHDLVSISEPKVIFECGTGVGYSALWLADAAKEYGGKVYGTEPEDFKMKLAKKHIEEAGIGKTVYLFSDTAENVFKNWHLPIDFLFLDANKNGYLGQFLAAEPHLSKDALIVADNVIDMNDRLQKFLDYIENDPRFQTEIKAIGHGLLIAKRKA